MEFLIADTFTDSLTRLTNEEQKAVKTTAFDLQVDPSAPGLRFHRLDKAKDKRFWSVRVSEDIRLIVHRDDRSVLLCYADHHDAAYAWAERRKVETHPKTGAAQLVEIRERVREILVPRLVEVEQAPTGEVAAPTRVQQPLFANLSDGELLKYGVPTEWLEEVREASEDTLLGLADHLPAEAAEALLELAVGDKPRVSQLIEPGIEPFEHPDARRRFRVVGNTEELERALTYPWEKWAVFLHPDQHDSVERDYNGPARISGSAGTGKTVVALHRAVHLARTNANARVLLRTFSDPLARMLKTKLRYLIGHRPRVAERIEVYALDAVAVRLYERRPGVRAGSVVVCSGCQQLVAGLDRRARCLLALTKAWPNELARAARGARVAQAWP
jgi:UvrD/REP helicase N-terminal domain